MNYLLLSSTDGHYAFYEDGILVSTWSPDHLIDLKAYVDEQVRLRAGDLEVVERNGQLPWKPTVKTPAKPKEKVEPAVEGVDASVDAS